ncbi:non-ribosomal peptide synthetase [Streptomyces sp. NPDC093509]|uniref:non-ribosomal peptide synthetase n=1 Tax=Streptomyces sp. NPDC093509 TaxID=3154982 RepID=UPI00344FA7F0
MAEPRDLMEAFLSHVRLVPDRTAVRGHDGALTFAELDEYTARLAGRLCALGVGRGDRVGVHVRRGVAWAAVPLAVWRAGAAYVPLDPAYPRERLLYIAEDAGLRAIVSDNVVDAPAWAVGLPVLGADGACAERCDDAVPHALDPAYVIYTSGSTGRPKGVEVTRGGVAALMGGLEERGVLPIGHRVVGWNASLCFDASVQQWARVCRGDTLVVLGDEDRTDPVRLDALLDEHGVTDLDFTPSHWQLIGPRLRPGRALRLLLGGESVPERLWRELAGNELVEAWNVYGPTECTVDATAAPITEDAPHIGDGLPGVHTYVLDGTLAPAATGELYLAGPTVAAGYVGRAGLTAERFVADPFAADGSRMYRTGDEVRRRFDGNLEFLGRTDRQAKVRGFRVEPGELEGRLREHPEVTAAVAAVRTGPDGDALLAAYYTSVAMSAVTDDELREHCAAGLPGHLVPSVLVRLDALPLTANGKVDSAALPPLDHGPAVSGRAPEGELEHLISDVWTQLLGRNTVSADDNFFALGGHSLVALRVVARLKRAGIALNTKDVYRFPLLSELARHAEFVRSGAAS